MLSCREAEERIEEALLSDSSWSAAVQSHLDGCAACRALMQVHEGLSAWPTVPDMPKNLVSNVMVQVRSRPAPSRRRVLDVAAVIVLVLGGLFAVSGYVLPSAGSLDALLLYLSDVGSGFASLWSPLATGVLEVWNSEAVAATLSAGASAAILVAMIGMMGYLNVRWSQMRPS